MEDIKTKGIKRSRIERKRKYRCRLEQKSNGEKREREKKR